MIVPVHIELSLFEREYCVWVAGKRRLMNRQFRIRDRTVQVYRWDSDIEGTHGECALAKAANCYWCGALGKFWAADVGRVQIRTTRHVDGGLILHDDDDDGDYFVSAIGGDGSYDLLGYMLASLGKKPEFLRSDWKEPAYCVPQSASLLKPMGLILPYIRFDLAGMDKVA